MEWDWDAHLSADLVEEQCLEHITNLIHDCDRSTRWKRGGGLTIRQDNQVLYTYYVTPKFDRALSQPGDQAPARCDVYYKFYSAEFYIYGGGFAGNDHGTEKLLPNLRRCGVVSEWGFTYFADADMRDDGMEWEAYGHLPIGAQQWDCVRRAVVDAGGRSDLGCGGA